MVKEIIEPFLRGDSFQFGGTTFERSHVADIEIRETPDMVVPFYDFTYGANVTDEFIVKSRKGERLTRKGVVVSKNVFIVHGRDHKPLKELKAILAEFGLNPIVLHEQPGGSRTIVEKLEKYSDIGYAFVILTPDDVTLSNDDFLRKLQSVKEFRIREETFWSMITKRARQNVVLEFGYFMGLLGRDRVCCLYKGDTELPYDMPSDMHGIVYIPFKESVNEVRDRIIKELKAVGYEIKI